MGTAESETQRIRGLSSRPSPDFYAILGLERGCSESDVKRAYRKLALLLHPDKCSVAGSDEAFKSLSHAHMVLSDPSKRKDYDLWGVDPDSADGKAFAGRSNVGTGPAFVSDGFAETMHVRKLWQMFFSDAGPIAAKEIRFTAGPYYRRLFNKQREVPQTEPTSSDSSLPLFSTPLPRWMHLAQLIPAILLGLHSVFYILSNVYGFFSGPADISLRPGAFAWDAHVPGFDIAQITKKNRVPYFVNARNLVGGNDAGVEERVEKQVSPVSFPSILSMR
ncbi:hypothetical protein BC830DRAFT_1140967 [Chytriomyces sp. MP71]|nr:hypothetical protein BC830DRAFT_1140967 [Chytriomyces sp. MP71]